MSINVIISFGRLGTSGKGTVSYTHLDVYKRQGLVVALAFMFVSFEWTQHDVRVAALSPDDESIFVTELVPILSLIHIYNEFAVRECRSRDLSTVRCWWRVRERHRFWTPRCYAYIRQSFGCAPRLMRCCKA